MLFFGGEPLAPAPADTSLARAALAFDAGEFDTGEVHVESWVRLGPEAQYDADRGHGWIGQVAAFSRSDVQNFRDPVLQRGVAAPAVSFRADVPDGSWWVTAWVEAGLEDSASAIVKLNGAARPMGGQVFPASAEPRTRWQKLYRIVHAPVQADDGNVRLDLVGRLDSVRVLALALHPDPNPESDQHRGWLNDLEHLGRYGEADSLGTLLSELADAARAGDAFASYWRDQVAWLDEAERFIRLGGWGWATSAMGAGIFDRFHQAVTLLDAILEQPGAELHPLYERASLARLRLLYWLWMERGGEQQIRTARRDIRDLLERYPEDPLLRMYAGEKLRVPGPCDSIAVHPEAPEWSILQLEVLCRLRGIAHWWVNEKQGPDGEFGGKLDDDVELLRWWVPLILSGDTTSLRGWVSLADAVWESDWLEDGYSRRAIDVEHASELIADTTPLLIVYADDPNYVDRLRPSARHFERLWTDLTPAGRRHFRSAWFSSTEVDERPPRNRDVAYNTRAVKAVRYLAWREGNEQIIRLLAEWSHAWVHAASRTEKEKPYGLFPASVRFPDESINGDEPTWYEANMFWDYFDWSGGAMLMDQAFFTFTLTGDTTLLDPLIAALDLVRAYADAATDEEVRGSAAWAAGVLDRSGDFWSTVAQWRLYTGDTRYDDLLLQRGTPYVRYRLTGDTRQLRHSLDPILDHVRYNTPLLTTEVLHTDRVYITADRFPGAEELKAMLTGDSAAESASPYFAVTWAETDEYFTALVRDAGPGRLHVQAFNHAPRPTEVVMRIWQLEPGRYRLNPGDAAPRSVEIDRRGQRIELVLPPGSLHEITIEPAE